jgi:hypothetical protein
MTASRFLLAALLLLFGLGLTACGVAGAPDPPVPDAYPHQYPPPETPVAGVPATAPVPTPEPIFPPNTTNTNQRMYQ